MKKATQYLLSPNVWVAIFSILAATGLMLCVVGFVAHIDRLTTIGLWLITPILIGGIIIVLAVLPMLVIANRKQQK